MQTGPNTCRVHPSCERKDACYENIMDSLVSKGGGDREEFTVPRHMESQCLTNESSTINSPSLGGYQEKCCGLILVNRKKI